MPSLLKLISYAFIPFTPEAHFQTWLSPWNSTAKPASMRSWNLRGNPHKRQTHSGLGPPSCMFFVTFRVWDQKAVHNTKQCSDLTLSSFVWCSHSPTCPSFPSAKIGPARGAAVGFVSWVIIVFEMELLALYKAGLSLWDRAHNLFYDGSQMKTFRVYCF